MRFISIDNVQNNYRINILFSSSVLLYRFFTSNSVVFAVGDARIFLDPGRKVSTLHHWMPLVSSRIVVRNSESREILSQKSCRIHLSAAT